MAGTYLLWFRLPAPLAFTAGALGEVRLASGVVAYVGSAFGPGGVAARLRRHVAGSIRRHWHVDHLRALCPVYEAWWCHAAAHLEHAWAAALLDCSGATPAVPRFGASDCRCPAHLIHFRRRPAYARLVAALPGTEGLGRLRPPA